LDIPERRNPGSDGFSSILADLKDKKATGTLVVRSSNFLKRVFLKGGEVVFASSNLEEDRLGEMLIKAGLITREQYDISVEILKKTGKQQGSILVELGFLTPRQLFEGLKFQIREIVLSLFDSAETVIEFREGELPEDEIIGLKINIDDLIREGEKRFNRKNRLSEEEAILKKKAEEFFMRIRDMSPADILQVKENSDYKEIKSNYYRLAKEFHPDRAFYSEDRELKERLTYIFDAITKAYNELKDDEKRQEFFKRISRSTVRERGPDLHIHYKRGMEEFRTGNYWGAAEVFRWLTRLDPKSPRAWQMLSRSLSHIPGRLKDAETALLEAIRLDPFNADYYTDLGHIYLKAGLKKRAKRQFEKALNIDSANGDALKGLNMINTMDDT